MPVSKNNINKILRKHPTRAEPLPAYHLLTALLRAESDQDPRRPHAYLSSSRPCFSTILSGLKSLMDWAAPDQKPELQHRTMAQTRCVAPPRQCWFSNMPAAPKHSLLQRCFSTATRVGHLEAALHAYGRGLPGHLLPQSSGCLTAGSERRWPCHHAQGVWLTPHREEWYRNFSHRLASIFTVSSL